MVGKVAQHFCQRVRQISKWKKEIDAADLGVAKVITWLPVLPIMPFDAVCSKVGYGGLANFRKQIFFCMVKRQAEWARLAFINSVSTSRKGEVRRLALKLRLSWFFAFKKIAIVSTSDGVPAPATQHCLLCLFYYCQPNISKHVARQGFYMNIFL